MGANGVLFLPYLQGERSPRWNPHAKGVFAGLKMSNKRGDLLRSVIEGIGMNLCIILRLLQQHMEITEMTIIGGLSKGDIVRQIFADIFGTDIIKLDYMDEVSSMGAAVVAGVGVGELGGFQDIDRFLKVNSVNKPVAEHTGGL